MTDRIDSWFPEESDAGESESIEDAANSENEAGTEEAQTDDTAEAAEEAGEGDKEAPEAGDEGEEEKAAKDEKGGKSQKVPLPELLEERRKRREAEQASTRLEERLNLIAEQWENHRKSLETQQQKAQEPKYEDDPLGYVKHKLEEAQKRDERYEQHLEQQNQQQRQMAEVQHLQRTVTAMENEFAQAHPDYTDAVEHLRNVRDRELELIGYSDPAQRQQQIAQEVLTISRNALRAGKSPAEVAYEMAKATGWAGKKAASEAAEEDTTTEEKLASVERGQSASRSLSQASGKAKSSLTVEAIAKMSDEDFEKAFPDDTAWEKFWART